MILKEAPMFALSLIIALMAGMAGLFATIVYQIAQARRQQFIEEASLNGYATHRAVELEKKAAEKKVFRGKPQRLAKQTPKCVPARRPHVPMLAR